jgi:hypothetical protein
MISPNLMNGHQGTDLNHSELPPDKSLHWPPGRDCHVSGIVSWARVAPITGASELVR